MESIFLKVRIRVLLYCVCILWITTLTKGTLAAAPYLQNPGKTYPVYAGAKLHYGFIIPHADELREVAASGVWGFQVDVSKLNISSKAWSNCNCYSRIGLSFDFFDYQNPDVLGHSYNLAFFFEPYFNYKGRSRISMRAGMGLTYLDKVYNKATNPDNLFFSSKLSGLLLLNLSYNFFIRDYLQMNVSFNYNHISNGGSKIPNKGMNFPTASIGIDYIFRPVDLKNLDRYPERWVNKFQGYIRSFGSVRTVDEDSLHAREGKLMIGLEGGAIRSLSRINGLLAGMEFSYDGSFREVSDRMKENYEPFVISLHAGHAFVIGKITFTQQMAYYLYRPFPSTSKSFFQRYGLYYRIGKWVSCGFSLKAHGHVAEHMDIRLGIVF